MIPYRLIAALVAFVAALSIATAFAQAPATGAIAGRVFNPATGEYVRNAELAVAGTSLVAYSADDGSFTVTGVPAGEVTLTLRYTGYAPASATLRVSTGATATRDFELTPAGAKPAAGSAGASVVKLDQFVVSSEREGNAKAIMEQRAAVNFKSVVSADNFGDLTGGTVGEFIKYLPGVVMDYVDSDARAARISGLEPRYASVSVDGMTIASAPSASFGADSRQFEFEQASIVGTDAIEINKTTTASMDADSPAGRINMRSRSAFDRKRREITATLSLTGNAYSWDYRRTPGPYDRADYKVRPSFTFTYAEAFKQRLGIALSLGGNTLATEQAGVTHTYSYADAARGPVINQIQFRDAPKLTTRGSMTLTTDYKISPHLSVSLRTAGSAFNDGTNARQIAFFVNPAQVAAGSSVTDVTALATANANTRVQYTTSRRNKLNNTLTLTPRLDYKRGDLTLTLGGGYSRSRTAYEQIVEGYFQAVTHRLTRMSWRGVRSSPTDGDWTMTQLGGLPWNDPANYNRADSFTNNISATPQAATNQLWIGYLDAKKTITLAGLPVQLGAGAKTKLGVYDLEKNGALQWTYVGAAGSMLAPTTILPVIRDHPYDARVGGNIGRAGIPLTDPYATRDLFLANPAHFTPSLTANHINTYYSARALKEQIDSTYAEANTRWRAVRLNLGVRHERTRTVGRTQDVLPAAVVQRAGFTPGTLAFTDYQYRFGRRESTYGGYGNTFLSGGARWALTENLNLQLAGSQSIARPNYANLTGTITIDEAAQTVRVPNPDLKPETSDKYFASLQYYIEPAGTVSVSAFRLNVENMGSGVRTITAAEAGYADDPEFAGYRFLRPENAPGTRTIDGVEVEYSQQLVFLPRALSGFSVFGSLTRTAADTRIANHVPKSANGGLRYGNNTFNAQLRATWSAPRFNSSGAAEELWQYERLMFDFSGGWRFNRTYELTVSGRNILNEPIRTYSNGPGLLRVINRYGASWTVGVRGRW
ncbi:MAG: TonB-dependent receptor [Opitutaceae bacterium]|nr:TonB-dependent receptor [Opitutaceae bacterium]